ncbi:MAG: ABC transporter substrate-binding protein [Thermoproteota archaeon]|nr:ABC transporter substrate-binding protein [Thermoproteota archaeon]
MNTKTKFGISIGIIIAIIITSQSDNHGLFSNNGSNNIKISNDNSKSKLLRLGYFPNVNHAQAIIGLKNGDFQKSIENNSNKTQSKIKINEFVFSDGPSAIEALFGGQIDAAYVGPNPAISGFIASSKEGIRIVSGAASGGAVFVVRNDAGIQTVKDLGGKKFASPQLGNTQDVALRKYLVNNGFKTVENGGNVTVVTIKPSDILTLMIKKEIDGAWVPEPWGARLVNEANGQIFVDERSLWPPDGKFVTSNIIVRTDYLNQNPDIVKKLLQANVDETLWINKMINKTGNNILNENNSKIIEVVNAFNNGLKQITGKIIPEDELKAAFTRTDFTYDPLKQSLYKIADDANSLGFISNTKGNKPDISGIYDLTLLNKVLQEKRLKLIP